MSDLVCEKYSNKNFVIRCDSKNKDKYNPFIEQIGGRWSRRIQGGYGWLISLSLEKEVHELLERLKQEPEENEEQPKSKLNILNEMKDRKKPRQTQTKYHRAMSEDEYTNEEEEEEEKEEYISPENATINQMFHPKTDKNMLEYYKKFTKNPPHRSRSLSDDSNKFPSPENKKKKRKKPISFSSSSESSGTSRKDMKKVVKQVKYLRSKIKHMEKLFSQN